MNMIDNPDELEQMINKMPENIRIIEDQIDVNIQQEYLQLAQKLKDKRMEEDEALELLPALYDDETLTDDKKNTIVQLAQTGGVKSFRELEKFQEVAGADIAEFARFGMHIARAMMESDLSDDNIGFVSSGLGGKNGLLRYFFCIFNLEAKTAFTPPQKKIIKKEFDLAFQEAGGEIEQMNFKGEYAIFRALAPLNKDFNLIVRDTLDDINVFGHFIFEGYFATNVKIPEHSEISKIIREIRKRDIQSEEEL